MKINIPRDTNGNLTTVVFDHDEEKILLEDSNIESVLSKGNIFKGIIKCNKIWYSKGGRFGIDWNMVQMKLYKKENKYNKNKNGAIEDTEDTEDEGNELKSLMIDDE